MYGIPGYDHLLPDESEAGEQAWRAEVGRFGEEAGAVTAATPAEAVTLGCVREAVAHERDSIDMAPAEHTVTAMQFAGPARSWRWPRGRSWSTRRRQRPTWPDCGAAVPGSASSA